MNVKANLIEPGTAYFMGRVLKNCGIYRKQIFNYGLNVALGLLFFSILYIILHYAKIRKLEKTRNKNFDEYQQQIVIMDTIKKIKLLKEKEHNELASNIPFESSLHHQDKIFL